MMTGAVARASRVDQAVQVVEMMVGVVARLARASRLAAVMARRVAAALPSAVSVMVTAPRADHAWKMPNRVGRAWMT